MGFLNIFQKINLVGKSLIQYLHLTPTLLFTNLPSVTGDCGDVICERKLREFFITGNKHYNFEDSLVSDHLQLQINRADCYPYAAEAKALYISFKKL